MNENGSDTKAPNFTLDCFFTHGRLIRALRFPFPSLHPRELALRLYIQITQKALCFLICTIHNLEDPHHICAVFIHLIIIFYRFNTLGI